VQQAISRLVNAIVGFLLGAFRSTDPNKPLPPPAPFPIGTPPTPLPQPPVVTAPPSGPPSAVADALKWNPLVTAFLHKWNGKYIPPKFGANYQCVALVNQFTSEAWHVFWPRLSAAGDFVGYNVPGFTFIRNTPTNYPYPGDIVEWGKSPTLPWGHIGIAVAADSMHLNSFDQNWPIGSPAHVQAHTYVGVSGWHRKN
jgi:hypothetical protein